MDEFYTAQQVASMLKVHKTTIYKWVKDGRLKAYKITYADSNLDSNPRG